MTVNAIVVLCCLWALFILQGLSARNTRKTGIAINNSGRKYLFQTDGVGGMQSLDGVACPSLCSCNPGGQDILCTGGRSTIPNKAPKSIKSVTYTNNRLPGNTLSSGALTAFFDVTYLDLSFNFIHAIDVSAFMLCRNLTDLVLDDNPFVNVHTQPFLNPVANTLQLLSLQNVVPSPDLSPALWFLFQDSLNLTSFQNAPISAHGNDFQSKFPSLLTLKLDKNFLTTIDVIALRKSLNSSILRSLSFSYNCLESESLLAIKDLLTGCQRFVPGRQDLRNKSSDPVSFTGSDVYAPLIKVNLTFNHIYKLSEFFTKEEVPNCQTSPLSGATLLAPKVTQHDYAISLEGNPILCNCVVNTTMNFLFKGGGKAVIEDWKKLTCHTPFEGLSLEELNGLKIDYCHADWNEYRFELTSAQLAFVIVCGTVFTLISILVVYLNRNKLFRYWKFIRHCGEPADYDARAKWRGALNKYEIPGDHKGVGERGYFSEEQAIPFEIEDGTADEMRS